MIAKEGKGRKDYKYNNIISFSLKHSDNLGHPKIFRICLTINQNIVKYNLHESKKELSFKNLTWLVNILIALPPESQNLVRIWINNIICI